jgi:hypothetical protein
MKESLTEPELEAEAADAIRNADGYQCAAIVGIDGTEYRRAIQPLAMFMFEHRIGRVELSRKGTHLYVGTFME